jgi:hypothetical protein
MRSRVPCSRSSFEGFNWPPVLMPHQRGSKGGVYVVVPQEARFL